MLTEKELILVGDIGGTKTVLALFSPSAETPVPVAEDVFPSREYASLEACVETFLAGRDVTVREACFGVAGPVDGGQARITNLPWRIDAAVCGEVMGCTRVKLLNDLAAIANAVPYLGPDDLYLLNEGERAEGGSMAVIAPGTGLGEAFLTWDGTHYRAYASEGGHTDFGPTNAQEAGLLAYLQERLGHVSYEQVCSGMGIPNLYAYLKDSGFAEEPDWLGAELAAVSDKTPVIVSAALNTDRPCPLAAEVLRLFVSILGAEAGNLALKVYATGGVVLGGGIPPRILPALETPGFMEAFRSKGRFEDVLARMPIHVIKNPKVALLGAYYALQD